MRLDAWQHVVDPQDFQSTPEFRQVRSQVEDGIAAVVWPPGNDKFIINPTKKENGVKPIKEAFIEVLRKHGWEPEYETFDAHYVFEGRRAPLPFAVEWETGNISSSHRAINRIGLGILEGRISGGVLVVPTGALYPYLTDRIGNLTELVRYIPLWEEWANVPNFGYFGVVSIEHDGVDPSVPLIRKGTDGRALI